MKRFRHLLEYAVLLVFLWVIDRTPVKIAEKIAVVSADLWFLLNSRRRAVAIDNILASGMAVSSNEAGHLARASFRHFALVVIEAIKLRGILDSGDWRSHVDIDAAPETLSAIEGQGKGVIVVSGHIGNWEVAARVLASFRPVTGIARSMNNPYTDAVISGRKGGGRLHLTPKHGADALRLVSALKNGDILALLVDQHAPVGGVAVEFFGRKALTYKSPAILHLVTGAPLFFGCCVRTSRMRFRLTISRPMVWKRTGNREADVQTILNSLTHELEEQVRRYPAQYLWGHRRWRAQ